MPELRHDPIQKRWVIIASERRTPPAKLPRHREAPAGAPCPFCEGNEAMTPPEIMAVRADGSPANHPGWLVRVVPNKFPALRVEGELERKAVGVHDRMNGVLQREEGDHLQSFYQRFVQARIMLGWRLGTVWS